MIKQYLDRLSNLAELREQWNKHRDIAVQHLSTCSNAVQEMTYLAGTAQEEFAANWDIFSDTDSNNPNDNGDSSASDSDEDIYNPLALATIRARETCRNTRDKEHEKLKLSIQEMTNILSQMFEIYDLTKAQYNEMVSENEEWETARIGMTWCCSDVLNVMEQITSSYQTELFVKACIVDDIKEQKEIDVLLSYAATFLTEPYIDENQLYAMIEAAKYDLLNNTKGTNVHRVVSE
jgi:hypothetical protein